MAISDKLTYLNTTKSNLKDMINYTGANITTETFRQYVSKLFDGFIATLNNPETLFSNLPKTTSTGTSLSINNTLNARMRLTLSPSELSQASTPSPSSPQVVHTISGNNTIKVSDGTNETDYSINLGNIEYCKIGNYSDEIFKSSGKNLYNPTKASTTSQNLTYSGDVQYIYLNGTRTSDSKINFASVDLPSGTYTINMKLISGTISSTSTGALFYVYKGNTWTQIADLTAFTTEKYATFTLTETTTCTLSIYYRPSETFTNTKIAVQITKGSTSDYNFEPYGTYWYIKKNIGKTDITSFSGKSGATANNQFSTTSITNILKPQYGTITSSILSNRFTSLSPNYIYGHDIEGIGINTDGSITIGFGLSSGINTLELANQWLSNNSTNAYYPLSTPTYTQITGTLATQLEDIYYCMSKEGHTNISQVNNDLPFIVNASTINSL